MTKFLIAGLINIETTLRVDGFPLNYQPIHYAFNGINSSVSGVGYNVAKALTTLGNEVDFLALIGRDLAGSSVRASLAADGLHDEFVLDTLKNTPQSVILYDAAGKRQIHVDLKEIQDQSYPAARFEHALNACDCAVICNINFMRPFLRQARAAGKLVATDVHTVSELDDPYNSDFMRSANILFMSDELLPMPPEVWVAEIMAKFAPDIFVIGLGGQGALLAVKHDRFMGRFPAIQTRPIVSTIGAGDALFSAFLHAYVHHRNPYDALRKAMVFASYKIGATSASDGFLSEQELDVLYQNHQI